jgi:hypothetical protein
VIATASFTAPAALVSDGVRGLVGVVELYTGAPLAQGLAGLLVALLLRARDGRADPG